MNNKNLGLLAAFTTDSNLELTVQMAFCHMFFNLFGILLFYPLPLLRLPLKVANVFGEKVVKYRYTRLMRLSLIHSKCFIKK
jgi:sodium-dependent phosphate cotransporter